MTIELRTLTLSVVLGIVRIVADLMPRAYSVVIDGRPAEASDPWWLAIIGFVSGVLAASYVRPKRS